MEEKVFLQTGSVLVSSSRVEISGQTFATRNIGSVKVVAPGISILAVLLTFFGLFMIFKGRGEANIWGYICAVVGAVWAYMTWARRELKLVAGGGEVLALKTKNRTLVEQVRAAIAEAISVR